MVNDEFDVRDTLLHAISVTKRYCQYVLEHNNFQCDTCKLYTEGTGCRLTNLGFHVQLKGIPFSWNYDAIKDIVEGKEE